MNILFTNEQSHLPVSTDAVIALARFVLNFFTDKPMEVGILFVDNVHIQELNNQYFQHDYPTDVISFPMNTGPDTEFAPELLGDIVVSAEKALEYAEEHGLEPYQELSLYLIHGLLHLLGYDDINELDKEKMFTKQDELLHQAKAEGILLTANIC